MLQHRLSVLFGSGILTLFGGAWGSEHFSGEIHTIFVWIFLIGALIFAATLVAAVLSPKLLSFEQACPPPQPAPPQVHVHNNGLEELVKLLTQSQQAGKEEVEVRKKAKQAQELMQKALAILGDDENAAEPAETATNVSKKQAQKQQGQQGTHQADSNTATTAGTGEEVF